MTHSALETLSRDLHAFADEAAEHLQDAAEKTGSDASDAVTRSSKAIAQAVERLRQEAELATSNTRLRVQSSARQHPIVAGGASSIILSLVAALAATFALVRLSQS